MSLGETCKLSCFEPISGLILRLHSEILYFVPLQSKFSRRMNKLKDRRNFSFVGDLIWKGMLWLLQHDCSFSCSQRNISQSRKKKSKIHLTESEALNSEAFSIRYHTVQTLLKRLEDIKNFSSYKELYGAPI